ncbi:hypothetical protein [Ensifer sp. ENS08]|uniref:hypothetical protein n=1 Tax=Ensifer sp. ENS08 TaxID=2769273 RepID=UPI001FEEDAAB|nr:hypothetical protein [Ensifer sp. ENS08]
MRGGHPVLQEVGEARAVAFEAEVRAGSELREELIGPASLEIELHFNDVATPPIALGHRADVIEPLKFLVPLMLEQDLELLSVGHRVLRIHLQFGQSHIELPADDLSLFMVGTMKAE